MFPILRRHWTLWAAWTMGSALVLYLNPWGPFRGAELLACLGSLLMVLDRRVPRDALLAIGLSAVALLAALDDHGVTIDRLILGWSAFAGASIFVARAVDDQRVLEDLVGQVVLQKDAARGFEAFRENLRDEIARARRHERPFAVLSVAPRSKGVSAGPSAESEVLARVVQARQVYEIGDALRDALHRYSRVVVTDRRVLCCVPELDQEALPPLLLRIHETIADTLGTKLEIGPALFPRDALSADDLIAAADDARRPQLASVSTTASLSTDRGGVEGDSVEADRAEAARVEAARVEAARVEEARVEEASVEGAAASLRDARA
jgi:hypothetical protein